MDDTTALVNERHKTHGHFTDHARITQNLKAAVCTEDMYKKLSATQAEAVEMILHKIGRIVAGNPSFADHWDDIAGYAKIANGQ
jgi:hypothetical protein